VVVFIQECDAGLIGRAPYHASAGMNAPLRAIFRSN
jgi:hypothetical protein